MSQKYVKLGEKANSFYDPVTGLSLIPNEVKEVPNSFLRTQRAMRFLKGGGIVIAHKEDFIEYQNSLNPPKVEYKTKEKEEGPEVIVTRADELSEMTKAALIEHVEGSEWEEGDIEKAKGIKKKSDLIEFIVETEKLYE